MLGRSTARIIINFIQSIWKFKKDNTKTLLSTSILGMALISGMAAVVGGVSEDEFLQSIEFLDNSPDEADGSPLAMDWRIAAHSLSRPRFTFFLTTATFFAFPSGVSFNRNNRIVQKCANTIHFLRLHCTR